MEKLKNILIKILNWIKKNTFYIINYVVLFTIYAINKDMYIELITGLWLFSSAAIGLYKLFNKQS